MFEPFVRDLRYSLRTLAQSPGFTAVTVLVLALGIGANTTIFTLLNKLFFGKPPHVGTPQELVRGVRFDADTPANNWSYPDFEFFHDHTGDLVELAAYSGGEVMTAEVSGSLFTVSTAFVSGNYFEVLSVPLAVGRSFHPEEDATPGSHAVVLISHGLWESAFGGQAETIGATGPTGLGATLRLNGHPCTVIGVVPEGFYGTDPAEEPADVWAPTMMKPKLTQSPEEMLVRSEDSIYIWLSVVGRVKTGATLGAAQSQVDAVSVALGEDFPRWAESGDGVRLDPRYRFQFWNRSRLVSLFQLLGAVVAVVLLIACVNVALLLLARASARRQEIAVRLALGASRRRLVGQLFTESLLLAVAGGLGGFFLAFWTADLAVALMPFEFAVDFNPDLRVLAVTLAVATLAALAFGLAPAVQASGMALSSLLNVGNPVSGRSRLSHTLVVVQIALSIVLVTGAALFLRSLSAATSVDLGYDAERRFVISMNLMQHGYDAESARRFMEDAVHRASSVGGVTRAAVVGMPPFGGMSIGPATPEGRAADDKVSVERNYAGPGYFELMDIPLRAGRGFTPRDRADMPGVVVINETAARTFWPGEDALGRTLEMGGQTLRVVGVAGDVRYRDLEGELRPYVYQASLQSGWPMFSLLVETAARPAAMMKPVSDALHALDPNVALTRMQTLEDAAEGVLGPYRVGATLVTLFGALALALAAVGLYGVLSYLVVQGTRVIAIRMALGATAARVWKWVLLRGLGLAMVGIVVGIVAALVASRFVERFLFQVEVWDPLSFLLVPVLLTVVAALASGLPARRAARVDPMRVLRDE